MCWQSLVYIWKIGGKTKFNIIQPNKICILLSEDLSILNSNLNLFFIYKYKYPQVFSQFYVYNSYIHIFCTYKIFKYTTILPVCRCFLVLSVQLTFYITFSQLYTFKCIQKLPTHSWRFFFFIFFYLKYKKTRKWNG